jgi:hypothetical protein
MGNIRLAISMVPAALWGKNLRKYLTRAEWDKLRAIQFEQAPNCEFCGSAANGATRQAHEEWVYDAKAGVACLVGLRTICRMCHFVEHRGLVNVMVAKGRFTPEIYGEIERHFCAVNACGPQEYRRHYKQAQQRYNRLMRVAAWTVDFGTYAHLIGRRRNVRNGTQGAYLALNSGAGSRVVTSRIGP